MTDARQTLCESLYPGGHGEERECVLPKGHGGAHLYSAEVFPAGVEVEIGPLNVPPKARFRIKARIRKVTRG